MIRFLRLPQVQLDAWLSNRPLVNPNARYRLRLWQENRAQLSAIQEELINYIDEALEDARVRIRRGFEDNLSPFNDPTNDPAANFPAMLNHTTLLGYLGEILAVIAVEHWGSQGYSDWIVPAFLFRYHNQEFQHLDEINQMILNGETYNRDSIANRRPGRTGDDALAFRIDGANNITDMLILEAKCLTRHKSDEITEAHEKLARGTVRPSGIRELISLLKDYETPKSDKWRQALLKLWRGEHQSTVRHDGVCYACGQSPVRHTTWMPANAPHPAYTSTRKLDGIEFHFTDLNGLVDILFRGD